MFWFLICLVLSRSVLSSLHISWLFLKSRLGPHGRLGFVRVEASSVASRAYVGHLNILHCSSRRNFAYGQIHSFCFIKSKRLQQMMTKRGSLPQTRHTLTGTRRERRE